MTVVLLYYCLPLASWFGVLYKLPALFRAPHNRILRGYWLTLLSFAIALTVLTPAAYAAIGEFSGIPNLARLVGHGFVLACTWALQTTLLHMNYPEPVARRRSLRRGWMALLPLVALTSLFALAPADTDETQFGSRYADAPFVLEYWLIFLGYLAPTLGNVAYLNWRYAKLTDRLMLNIGLRLLAGGTGCFLLYVVHEGIFFALRRMGLNYPLAIHDRVAHVVTFTGIGLLVSGTLVPAWGGARARTSSLQYWFSQYRSFRRLHPLWSALVRSSPEIALLARRSMLIDALSVRDLELRLYRRVIEIRDGRLALRPHINPDIKRVAEELGRRSHLSGDDLDAYSEAVVLATALRAKAERRPLVTAPMAHPHGGSDLEGERTFLEKVAWYYNRSPLVREALRSARRAKASNQRG